MPDPSVAAVSCRDVSKTFRLFDNEISKAAYLLGMSRFGLSRSEAREFQALNNISFDIKRGERVALVGLNGAGKTTLLRLILGAANGNFAPSSGLISVNGSIQALMNANTHNDLTGRENARMELLSNGIFAADLERAMEDVIEFVELGDYLDQPVGSYSLGMQARLQFAVATAVRPEILIVDEVLGAGDSYFSMKSADRMRRLAHSGCTLLFVSHSAQHVLQFCNRAIWLEHGQVRRDGAAPDVMDEYEATAENSDDGYSKMVDGRAQVSLDDGRQVFRWPAVEGVKIRRLGMFVNGKPSEVLKPGDRLMIDFDIEAERAGHFGCRYIVTIWSVDGYRVARIENAVDRMTLSKSQRSTVQIDIDEWAIGPGEYRISISIYNKEDFDSTVHGTECRYDLLMRSLRLVVESTSESRTFLYDHEGRWTCQARDV